MIAKVGVSDQAVFDKLLTFSTNDSSMAPHSNLYFQWLKVSGISRAGQIKGDSRDCCNVTFNLKNMPRQEKAESGDG